MADVLGMINAKDLLKFSQNYGVNRGYAGDKLFPALKTRNFEAEYYNLSQGNALPTLAAVHALDSEAQIGSRPTFDKISVEKLLIKEKINQGERAALIVNRGVDRSGLVKYVYDDLNNMGNNVLARAEAAKISALTTGTVVINENNLNFTIDLGVPGGNKVSADWGSPEHNIPSDIQTWVDVAEANGKKVNKAVTSKKILRYMQNNKYVQALIKSKLGVGMFITLNEINNLFDAMFGFTLEIDEDKYATKSVAAGVETRGVASFFPDNKFVLCTTLKNGAIGTGLYGVTPEENEAGPYVVASSKQYITFAQWRTPDPVALWSKASAMFIPVLPNADSQVIATISFDGTEPSLDNLTVTSSAGTASGDTAITVSPELTSGNSYRYKVATDVKYPLPGQRLTTWTAWDGTSDITAATGKEICIAEVDAELRCVKSGITTVTAHS